MPLPFFFKTQIPSSSSLPPLLPLPPLPLPLHLLPFPHGDRKREGGGGESEREGELKRVLVSRGINTGLVAGLVFGGWFYVNSPPSLFESGNATFQRKQPFVSTSKTFCVQIHLFKDYFWGFFSGGGRDFFPRGRLRWVGGSPATRLGARGRCLLRDGSPKSFCPIGSSTTSSTR